MTSEILGTDIADMLKGSGEYLFHKGALNIEVTGFSSFCNYKPETMTFIAKERNFGEQVKCHDCKIRLLITEENESCDVEYEAQIIVKNARRAFFSVVEHFFQVDEPESITLISCDEEIYKKHSFISEEASIGRNVRIGAGCVIEGNVSIGDDTEIHHNVVIRRNTVIGRRCTIHSGVVIGECGFNYIIENDKTIKLQKHYGGVVIEDDVHIGDNSCIIQGMIDDTVIKRGVKINTMAHIAHNCIIGEDSCITSPVHICGSVVVGKNCHIAASAIRNQTSVGDNALLGLGSVVVSDIEEDMTVVGIPAKPLNSK